MAENTEGVTQRQGIKVTRSVIILLHLLFRVALSLHVQFAATGLKSSCPSHTDLCFPPLRHRSLRSLQAPQDASRQTSAPQVFSLGGVPAPPLHPAASVLTLTEGYQLREALQTTPARRAAAPCRSLLGAVSPSCKSTLWAPQDFSHEGAEFVCSALTPNNLEQCSIKCLPHEGIHWVI